MEIRQGDSMGQPAIQNLDVIRQLIKQVRNDRPVVDTQRIRMFNGMGIGTNQVQQKKGDR